MHAGWRARFYPSVGKPECKTAWLLSFPVRSLSAWTLESMPVRLLAVEIGVCTRTWWVARTCLLEGKPIFAIRVATLSACDMIARSISKLTRVLACGYWGLGLRLSLLMRGALCNSNMC